MSDHGHGSFLKNDQSCKLCGDVGLHVCLPKLVKLLNQDEDFKSMVRDHATKNILLMGLVWFAMVVAGFLVGMRRLI